MSEKTILEVKKLTKVYPGGVVANYEVDFCVKKGEIHALIGENGAGKSTLMKMLFGMIPPTSGEIFVREKAIHFASSKDAIKNGIGMVHQHFMLVPSLTAAENLILGAEPKSGGLIDKKKAIEITRNLAETYHLNVDPKERVQNMSLAMKQKLEILKALYRGAEILILDEPTAVLTPQETEELFEQLKLLRDKGHTIIFISHKLNEVKELSDNLTVLRDSRSMGTYSVKELSEQEISKLMVGRDVDLDIEKPETEFGNVSLRVKDVVYHDKFGKGKVNNISFSVKEGQILGIAGIDGNGQSELAEVIIGGLNCETGSIFLGKTDVTHKSILDRQQTGLSYVSEDRMKCGSAPKLSLEDNVISKIYATDELVQKGLMDAKKIKAFTERILKDFKVKYDNTKQPVSALSGGNIQKLIVGREYDYDPKVFIVNQPTRGIDVGAIEFIRKKIMDLKARQKAILLISADLNEVISLSDAILVMHEGRIVGYIEDTKAVTENELGLYMLGVKEDAPEKIGGAYCE